MKKSLTVFLLLFISLVFVAPIQVSAATSVGVKPGSFFYFFDTAFEKVGLFFVFNPEKKARKALAYADERLAEIEAIAEEKNPGAVKTAIANYEGNIALVTKKSKEVKDKGQAESLLISIADNTLKNQEVLSAVLIKVPDEAKEAITQAISASRKGQEEAKKQIAKLKGEVEHLKKEVMELKQEKDNQQASEIEKLRNEVEELKKIKPAVQNSAKTANPQSNHENPEPQTFKLPNGAIVDKHGNILNKAEMANINAIEEQNRIINGIIKQRQEEARIAQEQEILRRQAESQRLQEEQNKTNQINALLSEYQQKVNEIDAKILAIKEQYYKDVELIKQNPWLTSSLMDGKINNLINDTNFKIQKLQLEQESLRMQYLNKINSTQ